MRRRTFLASTAAAAGRSGHRPRRGLAGPEVRAAGGSRGARPGLDHHLPDAGPRLAGVRYAVRSRQPVQGAAADGRGRGQRGRRQDLAHHAASRPAVPRRHQGAGARLRRLDQALGRARRLRPGVARGVRRDRRARRQDHPVPPEVSVPAAARCAGQDAAQHLPDHAGAARRHRPLQAGHRDGRQRPVSLQGRRTRRRLAHRLSAQHQVRAATERHGRRDRRPEGGALRPHRVADHSRRRHGRGGDAERRDRLVADAERRSAAAAEEAGAPQGRDGQSHRHDRHAAVQPPQPAVRQSGVAPRGAGGGRAGGLHDRRRRHRREPVARRGRHLLSRHAAGEPAPAWRC